MIWPECATGLLAIVPRATAWMRGDRPHVQIGGERMRQLSGRGLALEHWLGILVWR